MRSCQAIIVGAGPIGIELAVNLQRLGVDYVHLEARQIAHTISWYPRQARYFSSPERIAIAGVPLVTVDQSKATREEYLAYLRGVVQQFDLPIQTYEPVLRLQRDAQSERFELETPRDTYDTEHVILAIGDMHAPRRLEVPGEDLPHVSHYFDEPHPYFRKNLLIVGGRNSAVEAALRCNRVGARVTLSYRGEGLEDNGIKYWLLPEINALIKHQQIRFHPGTKVTRIGPDQVELTLVTGGAAEAVAADFVLLLTGYQQDKTLLEQAGVELIGPNRAPHCDPRTMMTNVPNLFIAGTAAAGTQEHFKLFIENSHPHVVKIARSITGADAAALRVNKAAKIHDLAES